MQSDVPYGLLLLLFSVALVIVFVCVTEASNRAKAVVGGLFLVSFAWRYGFYLRAVLSVGLCLYFTFLKARFDQG